MTGMQKVAVLLKSLPEEVVAKVLKHMDPRLSKILSTELSKVANDANLSEKLPTILDEAAQMLGAAAQGKQERPFQTGNAAAPAAADKPAGRPPLSDKSPSAANSAGRPLLSGKSPSTDKPKKSEVETVVDLHIDDELAARMTGAPVQTVATNPGPVADPLSALKNLPADLLAAALDSENARTVLIVMEKLRVDLAAQIYKLLTPAKRKEISLRFAEKPMVSELIVKQIAQGVLKKCQTLRSAAASATADQDREKLMATMIKGLERNERMEMLAMLGQSDPSLTERVKNMLYEFEVIARMENSSIQKLLTEVNMQMLALALRGAPAEIEERLMANLSKRAQETLREEMSLIGAVTPAKVNEARQGIVIMIQQLDQRGEFSLRE